MLPQIDADSKGFHGSVAFPHVEETKEFKSVVKPRVDLAGEQAAKSIELMTKKVVGGGLLRRRADNNDTYQKTLFMGDSNLNSTIVLQHDSLKGSVSWTGAKITFMSPDDPSYGITVTAKQQTDTATTGVVDISPALPAVPAVGTKFRIVVCTGMNSTANAHKNILTSKALRLALRDLQLNLAKPMQDGSYVCIIDPYMRYNFMDDKAWMNVSQYQDKMNIYNGEIGKMWNIRFVEVSNAYTEDEAGTFDVAGNGVIHFATLLAQDAYDVAELEDDSKKICIKTWEQLWQPLPLRSEVWWDIIFTTKILNANFGVNIACTTTDGATT
ncbi:MAG: N4-gp56 family major capsid protein [Endomicrobium sp.]|uniref:N4-gp56 family major capsid protein n=1 Tax=Candidatus Endomicrobiellum pyrsonymphae TaxID=1408203 RepID=UPI0035804A8F|nr:N4-gp56 family major capsid protein [Endomicrobium sp.]